MRTALDELRFRVNYFEELAKGRPANHLPEAQRSFFRNIAWQYLGIFLYKNALDNESVEPLKLALDMSRSSIKCDESQELLSLEPVLVVKSLLSEDLSGLSERIVELAIRNTNDQVNPLYTVLSCLRLGVDHRPHMDWFKKNEKTKYSLTLEGASDAIEYLANRDEKSLILSINSMLLTHHKEANNRHSSIYNSYSSFLSLFPYLLLDVAKVLGMNIFTQITNNKQTLKLGLLFPTETPELPKSFKMSIDVDYLTARTNF